MAYQEQIRMATNNKPATQTTEATDTPVATKSVSPSDDYEAHQAEQDPDEMELQAAENAGNMWAPAISFKDLAERPNLAVKAYCPGFIYSGAMTLLGGDAKAGKSTFMFLLLNAIANGEKFLGTECEKAVVLYVSEQNESVFKEQLRKDCPQALQNSKLRVILVENNFETVPVMTSVANKIVQDTDDYGNPIYEVRGFSNWVEQVKFWGIMVQRTHAKILVIDTFTAFSNLSIGEVNDPGALTTKLMALKSLYKIQPQLAIVLLHHLRKPSNKPGQTSSIRDFSDIAGSYAFRAATDQNMIMFKPRKQPENTTL